MLIKFFCYRVLGLFLLVFICFLPACGECVFDEVVEGTVVGKDNKGLKDIEIKTCTGFRCLVRADDKRCTTIKTDENGRFKLKVFQCRPKAFACELRPMIFLKSGCKEKVVQLDNYYERGKKKKLITVVLECGK